MNNKIIIILALLVFSFINNTIIAFDYLKVAKALTNNNNSPLAYPNKNIDFDVASRIYKNSLFWLKKHAKVG